MVRSRGAFTRLRRLGRLPRFVRRWRGLADDSGVSAVEFALILPIMLTLFFGGVELSDALTIDRKVTHVTSTLADLVTQSTSLKSTDMSNIFDAAASVITPYSTSKLTMVISQIKIDSSGNATVDWSRAQNTTQLTKGAAVTLPSAVIQDDSYLVMTEVHYSYTPAIGYVLTGSLDLHDTFYLKPRKSASVSCCS